MEAESANGSGETNSESMNVDEKFLEFENFSSFFEVGNIFQQNQV